MWVQQRGSDIGYKLIVGVYRIVGYKATKVLVWLVSFVYACITPKEKEAMKGYYIRVGVPYSFLFYVSHIYQFALSVFDRFVTRLDPEKFTIERVNVDTFLQKDKNRILALSHVGNWANTFIAFKYENRKIHITADEKLKDSIVNYESSLAHKNSSSVYIINLKDGLKASIEIAKALQAGDDLAIMVDRLVDPQKFVEVTFLNDLTRFNSNPFEVAYNRDINIVGVTVVRSGDMQYKIVFSDPIQIDKSSTKKEAIGIMAQEYAYYLETILREYPKQWFNFYEYWESE